jgi:hypothetical protein
MVHRIGPTPIRKKLNPARSGGVGTQIRNAGLGIAQP